MHTLCPKRRKLAFRPCGLLLGLAVAVVSVSACSHTPTAVETKQSTTTRPVNVLFILSDDQAYDTIGAHGNPSIETPSLDQLAADGMSFTHVFNQGSWSGAVCAPSRRMINTGRHLYQTGMDPRADQKQAFPVMGEVFRSAGYDTFQTGKWHLPMAVWERSFTSGHAVFPGGMSRHRVGGQFHTLFSDYDDSAEGNERFRSYRANQHSSEEIANAAIEFLSGRNDSQKPFMMYVGFLAPHDPRMAPDTFLKQYPVESIDLPESFLKYHPFDQGDYYLRDEVLAGLPRSESVVRKSISDYYAMISHMDAQIGRILNALQESGHGDNTVVIFTSDHGLAVGKHGLMGKQNQYDHSVRAPFIIRGPGIPGGTEATGMFYLNSVFPTAAELAGIEVPETVQAPSITPLLRGEKDAMFSSVYGSYRHFQRMVRTQDYKLIYYPLLQRTQLFDLKNDPHELNDLSDDPAHSGRIVELMKDLEHWKSIIGDPLENADPESSYEDFL